MKVQLFYEIMFSTAYQPCWPLRTHPLTKYHLFVLLSSNRDKNLKQNIRVEHSCHRLPQVMTKGSSRTVHVSCRPLTQMKRICYTSCAFPCSRFLHMLFLVSHNGLAATIHFHFRSLRVREKKDVGKWQK